MRNRILAFICCMALIFSCTPIPQQQAVLVTAMPQVVMATLAPTEIPTNTPTNTATPTLKPTPTETSPQQFINTISFKIDPQNYIKSGMTDGPPYYVGPKSNFEIILDPTGKLGGGYVYHAHMEGVPPPLTNTNDKHGFHRPSSPFHITEGNGPWAVSSDVFLKVNPDESYSNLGDDIVGKWLSIVSAGISTPQVAYDIKAGAFLVTGYGVPHLELYRVQNGGAGRVQGLSSYNPPLEFDLSKKHSVRLEFILIDEKPYVRLFQDGTFIDMTRIDDNAAKLPGSLFRFGGYAGNNVRGPIDIYNSNVILYGRP